MVEPSSDVKQSRVFVVYGRNMAARSAMFSFLRSLELTPVEWSQAVAMTQEGSPYIGRVLEVALASAQAIVVLMTPDEIAYLRSEYANGQDDPDLSPTPQARPNVLFEAGMAIGNNPQRTVLVELGAVRPFSDIAGRHAIRINNTPERRRELAHRLEVAGCSVNMSGTDWITEGNFEEPRLPGGGAIPLGKRIPSGPRTNSIRLDATYHTRANGGRLEILNLGSEAVFDVNVEVPDDAAGLVLGKESLPINKLPARKSAFIPCFRVMAGGRDHFEVTITGKDAEGNSVQEEAFISLTG